MTIRARARRSLVALTIGCLLLPQMVMAQDAIDESPNEFAMVGDLLVARPLGVVITVAGAAVWLVSLPFTLLSGHAGEAAATLVGGPAVATFMRCLGCRNPGYTGKDFKRNRAYAEKERLEQEAEEEKLDQEAEDTGT
jgi:hypothetical protein